MQVSTIGLVAAMPEEVNPFLKRIGNYRAGKKASFDLYRFDLGGKKIALIRSGMGVGHAATASRVLIEAVAPEVIISFGFGGALREGLHVGDLVLAEQLMSCNGCEISRVVQPSHRLLEQLQYLVQDPSNIAVYRGTFITTRKILGKRLVEGLLPGDYSNPVLEMESAAIAEVAAEAHIPFAAVRAISDAADEELEFSLDEFTDDEMNIRISRVLLSVAKKPWIIPQLLRLASNTSKAGKRLADGMEVVISGL